MTSPSLEAAIEPYTLGRQLGSGFFGKVHLLQLNGEDSDRVIKLSRNLEPRFRFRTEAHYGRMAYDLGIGPRVYKNGTFKSKHGHTKDYMIIERLTGGKFKHKPDYDRAMDLYQKLIKNGIYHNDLKSDNMMYHEDGRLMILDYGLATSKHNDTEHEYQNVCKYSKKLSRSMSHNCRKSRWEMMTKRSKWLNRHYEHREKQEQEAVATLLVMIVLFIVIIVFSWTLFGDGSSPWSF